MKIFLAGTNAKSYLQLEKIKFCLESFFYFCDWQEKYLPLWEDFILDSGAFTFMNNAKKNIDWDQYTERYATFIKKFNIDKFMELDIDNVVGLKEVERLRAKLEKLTKRQCIPVWHKSRGKKYFIQMCQNYSYVAIGGLVSKEISKSEYKYLSWFINVAHENGCKIHGLGFTHMASLQYLKFDSVDSTYWISGSRFGQIHNVRKGKIVMYRPSDMRAKNYMALDAYNMTEWIKFQEYAEKYL